MPYLYTHRPQLGVALSGQEEEFLYAFGDLWHGRLGRSSGGSKCAQVGCLVIEVRRREQPGLLRPHLALFFIIIEEFGFMVIRRVTLPTTKDSPRSSSNSSSSSFSPSLTTSASRSKKLRIWCSHVSPQRLGGIIVDLPKILS